ncbi:MAG: thioredoxin family protein, partial [Candidatus Omnitrophota bacterium]
HLFDVREFSKRGVMLTPAVIIDGEIVTSGKIPTVDELKELVSKK